MVVAIDGVVKLDVVPNKLVHAASENQSTTEPANVPAVNKTVPSPQRLLGVVDDIVAFGLTVALTNTLVELTHPVAISLDDA